MATKVPEEVRKQWEAEEIKELEDEAKFEASGLNKQNFYE
jgi:hypothetical protein